MAGPLRVVGCVDDIGNLLTEGNERQEFSPPGASASARSYYLIPSEARSLFDAERLAKARLFEGLEGRHLHLDTPETRLAAEAMIYLGLVDRGRALLDEIGVPVETPLKGLLTPLANDPAHPLALDAVWLLRLRDNPRFSLCTKSSVTSGDTLPLQIDAAALQQMTFIFAKLEGAVPTEEALARAWLKTAKATPTHRRTLEIAGGKSTVLLPLAQPGTYRVTAEARGRSCSFIAIRADADVEMFALPAETKFRASRPGLTLTSGSRVLGTSDDEGWIVPAAPVRTERHCIEHRECCSTCVSCNHHHADAPGQSDPRVFVAGQGQLFRAQAKIDTAPVSKVQAPVAAPILLVYTDRPAYKAGDTMRFRGILRLPKSPIDRKDATRLLPGAEREVTVAIRCGETSLFQRTFVTGEFGSFAGEFTIPLTASRSEYALSVATEGTSVTQPFEVLDYRKSDFTLTLTPEAGGVRVAAGYVWGAPLPGATLRCAVGEREIEPRDGLVALKDGERLRVTLLRDGQELAKKTLLFRAPVPAAMLAAAPAPSVLEAKTEGAAPSPAVGPAKAPEPPTLRVHPSKPLYTRGEVIEVAVEAPPHETEATVLLADVQIYDLARIDLIDGRGVARFPVRALLDPGVSVFALCGGKQARADLQVRAEAMPVAIAAPAKGRPGETMSVTLKADPNAWLSLAAVDEAIYMIREDDTPEIYAHFHPARPAALAYARFEGCEFDGEIHKVDSPPEHPSIREAELVGGRPVRGKGLYTGIGAGGRYGMAVGGKRNMVFRGGGGGATEDSVLICLKGLAPLQKPDGSWSASFASEAGTIGDVGATGLALLAKLGAGYSHLSKDTYGGFCFGDVMRNALQWLVAHQDAEGAIGPREGDFILNHAIAALALGEAYGLTGSDLFKAPAQKALDFLAALQSGNGGWHRSDRSRNGELLATAFGVMVLRSAQLSGLAFPAGGAAQAARFFDAEIDEDGLCGDNPTRAKVACGLLALQWLRRDKTDLRVRGAVAWLLSDLPKWEQQDFLGWHLASLALFNYDGPKGRCWTRWNEPLKNMLVTNQARSGHWKGHEGSVFHTSLASLALHHERAGRPVDDRAGGDAVI